MTDIAELGLAIRSDGVVVAKNRLKDFQGQADKAERSTGALARSFKLLTPIVSALSAVFSVRVLSQMADQYTSLSNILKVVSADQSSVNHTIANLNAIAGRTRSPLSAIATLYQRAAISAGELGASQSELLRFTENVGLALAQQGGSAASASGALLQLSQALGAGVVRAEEFNSILEGAFPIAQAAARGIEEAGGSVGKLRKLIIDGKITSDEFFNAILSQTDELEKAFANTVPTIGQAFTVMGNNFTVFVGRLNEASGVTGVFSTLILAVANNLERTAAYFVSFAAFLVGPYVASFVAARIATFSLAGALTTLKAILIRTGIGVLAVGVGELIYQFTRLVEKTGSVGGAFAEMGSIGNQVMYAMALAAESAADKLEAAFRTALAGIQEEIAKTLQSFGLMGQAAGLMQGAQTSRNIAANKSAAADLGFSLAGDALSAAFADTGRAAGNISDSGGPATSPGLSDEAKKLAKAYDKIVLSATQRIGQMQIEQQALGMTEEAANKLRYTQDLLNQAANDNIKLTPQQATELQGLAAQMAATEAQTNRLTEAYNFGRDAVRSFFSDFRNGIKEGQTLWESFGNAAMGVLDRLADRAMQMLADGIWNLLFGAFTGGGGGLGGGLLGGSIIPGILHNGGIAGTDGYGHGRSVDATAFIGAPRYHNGGIAGLQPNEVPTILQRGERVIPANQNGGYLNITIGWAQGSNGNIAPVIEKVSGEVAGMKIRQAAPQIIGTAVSQSTSRVIPTMAKYQAESAGSDYR